MDANNMSADILSDESRQTTVESMFNKTFNCPLFKSKMASLDFVTDHLSKDKTLFFDLINFYHYFSVFVETAVDERDLEAIEESLCKFYGQVIDVCYHWNCLSNYYENDFRLYNCIQLRLKSIIETLNKVNHNNTAVNKCIPLLLSSMIIIVSTIHDFKEVVVIAKPITDIIIDRKTRKLSIDSNEWKQLIIQLTSVSNIWKMIASTEKMDEKTFSEFLVCLFDYAITNDPFIRHISRKAVKRLSVETNISLNQMFIKYQFEISAHIIHIIDIGSSSILKLLYDSMSVFNIPSLPRELLRHIVPYYAVRCDEKRKLVINEISTVNEKSVHYVIKVYFIEIIHKLFYGKPFPSNIQLIQSIIAFLSVYGNLDFKYGIRSKSYELINSFLLQFSKDNNSTLEALAYIYYCERKEQNVNLKLFYDNEEHLRSYLKEYFLPSIHRLDELMMNFAVTDTEKRTAVESFVFLLQFMGRECVNNFRVKIFATIKLILSEKFYPIQNLIVLSTQALMQFLRMVDDNYLSSQLLTISALILPLMHLWPNETSNLFKQLVVEHQYSEQFKSEFKNLYFIPDMPELTETNKVLNPFITYSNTNEDQVCKHISLVIENINHENSRVQVFSLRKLKNLLKKHRLLIHKKCNDIKEDDYDFFVNHIIIELMFCLKSIDNEVLLLVADCLGVLGAIDPLKIDLDKPIISKEEQSEHFLPPNSRKFKSILITLLVRAITTAVKTDDQYRPSFALQEIVKYYTNNIGEHPFNWAQDLPQEQREYCAVLQKTKYNLKVPLRSTQVLTEPIFGSDPDMTFTEWLNKWLSGLFHSYIFRELNRENESNSINDFLSQPQTSSQPSNESDDQLVKDLIKHAVPVDVLNCCYLAVVRNQNLAQFLLPYIVITSLKNANLDQRVCIVNEIKSIFQTLTNDGTDSEIAHLISQTVFRIYDYLKVWFKNRNSLHRKLSKTPRHLKSIRMRDKEFKGVKFFVESISSRDLAFMAFNCNAFSRSLRYLEDYVKENNSVNGLDCNTFSDEIPFFQKIFIKLDDPDSVEGCDAKRISNSSITDKILTHEACGQIQEALLCCGKAIQLESNDFAYQAKYLQLLMESFDQSAMVNTYGTGLMSERPDWKPKLAPYVIEAVWKLGSWDQLSYLLEEHENTSFATFGSGVGNVFCTIMNRKSNSECEDKIRFLKQKMIGPLSAAAMEISGYVRGHQYIVNLHILNDIQLAYNKLLTKLNDDCCDIESFKSTFERVVNIWDQRNDVVRKAIKCREPILNAQRAIFSILDKECDFISPAIKKEMFKSWLMSTKISRKSANIQRAYNCLLEVNKARQSLTTFLPDGPLLTATALTDSDISEAILESAKVQWARNDSKGAIKCLKDEIEQNFKPSLTYCFKEAVKKLGSNYAIEEIGKIAKSLSIDFSPNSRSSLSSLSTSGRSSFSTFTASASSEASEESLNLKDFAKLQLLYTKYSDMTESLDLNALALMYKSVTIAHPEWEESHYSLGMFCNKIFVMYEESQRQNKTFCLGKPEEILDMKGRTVRSLAESLKYGVKHAHNSLPILLNIWYDLGTEQKQMETRSKSSNAIIVIMKEIKKTLERITDAIENLIYTIPSFIFFISFDHLLSRILHSQSNIVKTLKLILSKLVIDYPQQSMWLLMRSINSYNINRRNITKEILNMAVKNDRTGTLNKFIIDIRAFAELMLDMCHKIPDNNNSRIRLKELEFNKTFPKLYNLFSKTNFSKILLPFDSLINVKLPNSALTENYNAFPHKHIYIESFNNRIEVMNSLQKPKKIVINGSDGNSYIMLCKNGDDLRKDNSFIKFSNLLNRCFKRDPEARRRQLGVKTYLVVPLDDNCGIIEWIPGLSPMKSIIEDQYKLNIDYNAIKSDLMHNYPNLSVTKSERIRRFQCNILPKFEPQVLTQWFVSNYTDPLSWFTARLSYTRSSAVFSIIGYLLGLGDRHGENILIDETTGESVHIDLNCVFNKGEEFQYPETVPFRLTHNMTNAMGVTEFDGTFRKACEHTLRIARTNKVALINFVAPFRYDHLYEWTRRDSSDVRHSSQETNLDTADKIVFNIEARLNGIPSRNSKNLPKGLTLSVEGQVDHVIREAIDIQNLGVMFVGWAPYL